MYDNDDIKLGIVHVLFMILCVSGENNFLIINVIIMYSTSIAV